MGKYYSGAKRNYGQKRTYGAGGMVGQHKGYTKSSSYHHRTGFKRFHKSKGLGGKIVVLNEEMAITGNKLWGNGIYFSTSQPSYAYPLTSSATVLTWTDFP